MDIFLARHGQTTGDIEERYGGDYDDHLTSLGQEQAAALAKKLNNKGIEKLYSSPLIRAKETASIVGKVLNLQLETLAGFKERNSYGILTGMRKQDALKQYPDEVALLADPHNSVTGAESYSNFKDRVLRGLTSLSQSKIKTVTVVTHGGPLHLIFRDILQLGEIDIADCAIVHLEYANSKFSLVTTDGISRK